MHERLLPSHVLIYACYELQKNMRGRPKKSKQGFRTRTDASTPQAVEALRMLERVTPSVELFVLAERYRSEGVLGHTAIGGLLERRARCVYQKTGIEAFVQCAKALKIRADLLCSNTTLRQEFLTRKDIGTVTSDHKFLFPATNVNSAANVAFGGMGTDAPIRTSPMTVPADQMDPIAPPVDGTVVLGACIADSDSQVLCRHLRVPFSTTNLTFCDTYNPNIQHRQPQMPIQTRQKGRTMIW
jgi:hypothetical protein